MRESRGDNNVFKNSFKACQTPGYFVHPVLGCIGIIISPRTAEQWAMRCAKDGAELILINSASENQALANLMCKQSASIIIIKKSNEKLDYT